MEQDRKHQQPVPGQLRAGEQPPAVSEHIQHSREDPARGRAAGMPVPRGQPAHVRGGSSLSAEPLDRRLADGFGLGQNWTETLIASSRKAMTSWISFRIYPLPLADGE
jgi:hypothetical protein